MNNDRFKFRVWDKATFAYVKSPMAIFDDGSLWNYNGYEIDYKLSSDLYIIERCIGLKDKNGRLIYEGDIINFGWFAPKNNFIVKWDQEMMRFIFCESRGRFPGTITSNDKLTETVIVGNIHEAKWGIESDDDKSYKTNKSYGDEGKSEVKE